MITLTEFLLARIAEDRTVAQGVIDRVGSTQAGEPYADGSGIAETDDFPSYPFGSDESEIDYFWRFDPRRMLVECEVKRLMVTTLSEKSAEHWGPRENPHQEWEWCPKVRTAEFCQGTDLEWGPDAPCECAASWPDYRRAPLLSLLALPYANHQDYRSEWKPS